MITQLPEEAKVNMPVTELEAPEMEIQEMPRSVAKYISTDYLNPAIWAQMKGMAATFFESKALPAQYKNMAQVLVGMQVGYEMGMKPMESLKSLYNVNGTFNLWGAATINRLRQFGYKHEFFNETPESVSVVVTKGDEKYEETLTFVDAVAGISGWGDRPGWKVGINRKKKLRYGVIALIINTYIPEVLGSAQGIQELAEDFQVIEVDEGAGKPAATLPQTDPAKAGSLKAILQQKEAERAKAKEKIKKVEEPKTEEPSITDEEVKQ